MARYSSPLVAHMVAGVIIALQYFNLPSRCTTFEVRDVCRKARKWSVRYHQLNLVAVPNFGAILQLPNVGMRHPNVWNRMVAGQVRLTTLPAAAVIGVAGYAPAVRLNPYPEPAPVAALIAPLVEIANSRAHRRMTSGRARGRRVPGQLVLADLSTPPPRVMYNWLPEFLISLGALYKR